MSRPIVLGTRGSALALAQVELTEKALRAALPDIQIEVKKITTSGDRRSEFGTEMASGAGVKGLFTKEIEQALINREIDVAVHSCKDLPGNATPGLEIGATLPRANTADVFIGRRRFSELPDGAVIGTSSVRRRRQLLWLRPGLRIEELRGNVPTRIEKLRTSETLSGIVLARAGLDRLCVNLSGFEPEVLPVLPAIGQGAVALQCRAGDEATLALLARINHIPTFTCIRAERELLRLLNGDCHLPVAAGTTLANGVISMQAIIFGAEDAAPLTGSASGPEGEPEKIAQTLFQKLHP